MEAEQAAPRLIEPVPIDDELCSELAAIEDMGFGARFVIAAVQTVYETGEQAHVIKRKIVLSDAAIARAFTMTMRWMFARAGRFARETFIWLVK